ncbi:hypothetical protein [Tissierella praeacuta]|uniref:hypothetical protein n=1 Tax=Tissierella praeacuta TaxID=43131 RepID=UPI000ED5745B|nr:hypothetical protein [Tissierella praeacuta]MBU5257089.1 hypothetical protein [Tissierella praeacuta]HAE92511.1 hypothetical protein [Tissierella sp.]
MKGKTITDAHNAGDFGLFLVGTAPEYALTKEELANYKTDEPIILPVKLLEKVGLFDLIKEQYNL